MSMQRYPTVSVVGPPNCPDPILRAMSDLEMKGFLVVGPHIWMDANEKDVPIKDYDAYKRWKLVTGKGHAKLKERLNDLMKQRIAMSQRLVVVDVDGIVDPQYIHAVKWAFSYGVPVDVWEYIVLVDSNKEIAGYKKVKEKTVTTLPEALYE